MINPITDVEPIPGEVGCFWVQSESRPRMKHRVEIKPPGCHCEAAIANVHTRGKPCRHIERLASWIGWDVIIKVNQKSKHT